MISYHSHLPFPTERAPLQFTMTAAFFSIPRARLSFFLPHSFCSRRLRHRRDSVLPSAAVISRWDHT